MMLIQRGVSLFIVLYINLFFIQFTNAKEVCKGPGLKITPQDGYIYLSGNLCPGDGEKFVQYISNSSQSYKVVRLNLTGGGRPRSRQNWPLPSGSQYHHLD